MNNGWDGDNVKGRNKRFSVPRWLVLLVIVAMARYDEIIGSLGRGLSTKSRRQTTTTTPISSECMLRMNQTVDFGGPPRQDFQGRIVYFSMGNSDYIPALEIFVQSLLSFDIPESDIGIVCIDHACSEHFQSHYKDLNVVHYTSDQIPESNCLMRPDVPNTRCLVSMGKANVILDHLRLGHAVYFVDADVLFYQHPYKSMRVSRANLDLYVQADLPSPMDQGNFGLFLAYPSKMTISLFEYIAKEFDRTQTWDQKLFNDWLFGIKNKHIGEDSICGDPYDFEILPRKQFVNLWIVDETYNVGKDGHTAVHGTCMSKSKDKFFAMRSMFGTAEPGYYSRYKTVAVDTNLMENNEHYSRTMEEDLDRVMRPLLYAAKKTKRALRIPVRAKGHFSNRTQPFRVVSAHRMSELGITPVENEYWERAYKKEHRTPAVKRIHLMEEVFSPVVRFRQVVLGQGNYHEADELLFSLEELLALPTHMVGELSGEEGGYKDGKWQTSVGCKPISKDLARCLQPC